MRFHACAHVSMCVVVSLQGREHMGHAANSLGASVGRRVTRKLSGITELVLVGMFASDLLNEDFLKLFSRAVASGHVV